MVLGNCHRCMASWTLYWCMPSWTFFVSVHWYRRRAPPARSRRPCPSACAAGARAPARGAAARLRGGGGIGIGIGIGILCVAGHRYQCMNSLTLGALQLVHWYCCIATRTGAILLMPVICTCSRVPPARLSERRECTTRVEPSTSVFIAWQSIGALVHWCIGALAHWCIGALAHWCIGAMVHWRIGALVHWCIGGLVSVH